MHNGDINGARRPGRPSRQRPMALAVSAQQRLRENLPPRASTRLDRRPRLQVRQPRPCFCCPGVTQPVA